MNRYPCPFCPKEDQHFIERDFFGQSCHINGVLCCEVCQIVHDPDEPLEVPLPALVRIVPRQCEISDLINGEDWVRCPHTATWQYEGTAVCLDDMKAMAAMNSENEEAFAPALASVES
jgi:hypothetical protein